MACGKISTTFPLQEEVENGRNRRHVQCQRCPSIILSPKMAIYKQVEEWQEVLSLAPQFPLPHMKQSNGTMAGSPEEEMIKDYWMVDDMYFFENVGFSYTVGGVKYLACADCEVGPIGWFDTEAKISYVALSRVLHGNG